MLYTTDSPAAIRNDQSDIMQPLSLITLLPLLEIIGFITIGGRIGFLYSLCWLVAAAMLGFSLLQNLGAPLRDAREKQTSADGMAETLCTLAGALLLIFPGFVSDLLALPLVLPPLRALLLLALRKRAGFAEGLSRNTQGFTSWYYEERATEEHGRNGSQTIEGEFRREDDTKKLD